MSLMIPDALSLVQHHLHQAVDAERARLATLHATVTDYASASESLAITEKLLAWGLADRELVEVGRASVRAALDALLLALEPEMPRAIKTIAPDVPPSPGLDLVADAATASAVAPSMITEIASPLVGLELPLPLLRAQPFPVVIFGGEVRSEKRAAVSKLLGRGVPWFSNRAARRLEQAVKNGHIAAVVLLEGLTGHVRCGQIRAACKRRGIPTAFADTGGTRRVQDALLELESRLAHIAAAE